MKTRIFIGLITAAICLALPYLSRLPYGLEWVEQYRPDDGYFSSGMLFFQVFAVIPSIVTFLSAIVSRSPYYLPVLLASFAAFAFLILFHHANDLAADAQSALTLIFIPIFAAGGAILAGGIGLAIQEIWLKPKSAMRK